ncbi:RidA family protein [Agrobacterium vitis]|uniref:RidA family protein n=1 Tax=Agrobacterium vitis TaxID=373 RepID=UPI0012E843E5|nr:RidA family protein [Agrobacterium vitis]MVA22062.1 RidA family protein [Agrobacterium vitis]
MTAVHLVPYVRNGNMVITSGQLAFNEAGRIEGDITQQTTRVLRRIETLLAESGMNLHDVGKTSVWLVNADDFIAFNAAYAEVFCDHMPARSTVVSQLTAPGALIEIEAIAWKRD